MAGAVLVALVGLALRLYAIGRYPINADEAVVALMAREILHGHFFAFYWGQAYGGGEPYVVAAVFAVLGQSRFTLGLTPVLLDIVAVVLVQRVGRRLFSPSVGTCAALLFWIWPEVYVWQSTMEYGFRWVTLDCGLVASLLALRQLAADDRDARAATGRGRARLEWTGFGLFAGVGFWSSPEIAYFLIPVAIVFVVAAAGHRLRLSAGGAVLALGAFALGSLPWWWSNVRSHFASLHSGTQPDKSFLSHLKTFDLHVLPMVLGLQLPSPGRWATHHLPGVVIEHVAIVAGIVFLVILLRRGEALFLVAFLALFPFVYSASPFTWYWQDGRYGVYLAPMAAIAVAAAAAELARVPVLARRIPMPTVTVPTVIVALGLALTLVGASEVTPFMPDHVTGAALQSWTTWRSDPDVYDLAVDRALAADGVHRVVAGYWLAYPLDFESHGELLASDVRYSRYAPYLTELESGGREPWLFVASRSRTRVASLIGATELDPLCAGPSDRCLTAPVFEAYLTEERIPFTVTRFPSVGTVLVSPGAPVDATTVVGRFR